MAETTTIRKDVKKEENKPIPAGSQILSTNTTTDVEKIENGYLITKRTETRYKEKGKDYSDWYNETKKWYSKTDPLTINVKNKSLADAFDEG